LEPGHTGPAAPKGSGEPVAAIRPVLTTFSGPSSRAAGTCANHKSVRRDAIRRLGGEDFVTTYTFNAIIEPDDDRWHAYCPTLVERGGATWGETREEALANLEEVVKMVVASRVEHGEPIVPNSAETMR
jgi:predicted RNase H-like HicB family nuclease